MSNSVKNDKNYASLTLVAVYLLLERLADGLKFILSACHGYLLSGMFPQMHLVLFLFVP